MYQTAQGNKVWMTFLWMAVSSHLAWAKWSSEGYLHRFSLQAIDNPSLSTPIRRHAKFNKVWMTFFYGWPVNSRLECTNVVVFRDI
jgi:hypothetical protein